MTTNPTETMTLKEAVNIDEASRGFFFVFHPNDGGSQPPKALSILIPSRRIQRGNDTRMD